MSKHRVFIYGSCVSRDTFEHFDPEQFELVQYVARQSALSAYTRPVTLVEPPQLESPFQQRMVSGDFASSMQTLIPEAAHQTDLVLVDLTDERLGAYVLPDGSVITRSTELINSGAENQLPAGSQHLPFGSEQHFQYWSQGIAAVGELFRNHMPHAAVVLLDIPWAERSETGAPTPDSFGVAAAEANPVLRSYVTVAAEALGAQVISIDTGVVTSSPDHPWGDAPFHYSRQVYAELTRRITGTDGRDPWGPQTASPPADPAAAAPRRSAAARVQAPPARRSSRVGDGPNFFIAGARHAGSDWLAQQLGRHPDVFIAKGAGSGYFDNAERVAAADEGRSYRDAFADGEANSWRGDHSPDYFWHSTGSAFGPSRPDTASHIKSLAPLDAPVFLVLREPVARAMSTYWHHFSLGRFNLPTGIFQLPPQLGVVDPGFYRRHYEHWAGVLGADRLHVLIYDDLVKDPRGSVNSALRTLGLEPPDAAWHRGTRKPSIAPKPWVKPFQERRTVTGQELTALFELYRRDVVAVESIIERSLPAWRSRTAIVRDQLNVSRG